MGKGDHIFTPKTWAILALISMTFLLLFFVALPFFLATIMPVIRPSDEYKYLVNTLDGVALIVGIVGTVSSVASIGMTLLDRKRYNQESEQTKNLFYSVNELHDEIKNVNNDVKSTIEQNKELALLLYKSKEVDIKPNAGMGILINELKKYKEWENKEHAGETDE